MDSAAFEKLPAYRLPRPALEEDVVRQHHRRATAHLEFADDVLEEVELLVRCGRPEFIALVFLLLGGDLAVVRHDGVTAFLAEGRVGEDYVELPAARLGEGVGAIHGRIVGVLGGADPVQVEVHRAEADDAGDDVGAAQRLRLEVLHRRPVELVVLGDMVVGGEQEASGAAGGIADHLPRLRIHHLHDGADQRTRGEILPRPLVRGAGGLFEQAFVDRALDVHIHSGPILLRDHPYHPLEIRWVGDLVLRLAENDPHQPRLLAEGLKRVAVVDFEIIPTPAVQLGPLEGNRDRVVEAQLGHLVGKLEEKQVGDLLHVVAVTDPRVLEDVGVIPDFGDDGGGVVVAHMKNR